MKTLICDTSMDEVMLQQSHLIPHEVAITFSAHDLLFPGDVHWALAEHAKDYRCLGDEEYCVQVMRYCEGCLRSGHVDRNGIRFAIVTIMDFPITVVTLPEDVFDLIDRHQW